MFKRKISNKIKKVLRYLKSKDSENGMAIVEATIVYAVMCVAIVMMVETGMILYHRTRVTAHATETANEVASVYAATYKDPFIGYIDNNEFYKTELYRYATNVFTAGKSLDAVSEEKAQLYASYMLYKTKFISSITTDVSAEVILKPYTFIQHQVVVTVTEQYRIPLIAFFLPDDRFSYTITTKSDCLDMIDYMNTVDSVNNLLGNNRLSEEMNSEMGEANRELDLILQYKKTFNEWLELYNRYFSTSKFYSG